MREREWGGGQKESITNVRTKEIIFGEGIPVLAHKRYRCEISPSQVLEDGYPDIRILGQQGCALFFLSCCVDLHPSILRYCEKQKTQTRKESCRGVCEGRGRVEEGDLNPLARNAVEHPHPYMEEQQKEQEKDEDKMSQILMAVQRLEEQVSSMNAQMKASRRTPYLLLLSQIILI